MVDMQTEPLRQVNALSAAAYFTDASELLQLHPPHLAGWSTLARLKRIGIERGKRFEFDTLDPAIRAALEPVPADARRKMQTAVPHLGRVVNGWVVITDSIGTYGNCYVKRADVTLVGLGANRPEDAVYPLNVGDADGKPLDGDNASLLHFEQQDLPPVDAFWSVTRYDADGFPAANPIDRFAIGDRDALAYNADGSLDLHLHHHSPGAGEEASWLPAPRGPLGVTMRLYAPTPAALDGAWNPPAIKKVGSAVVLAFIEEAAHMVRHAGSQSRRGRRISCRRGRAARRPGVKQGRARSWRTRARGRASTTSCCSPSTGRPPPIGSSSR